MMIFVYVTGNGGSCLAWKVFSYSDNADMSSFLAVLFPPK